MKYNRFRIFLLSACAMFAFGCGDSGNSGNASGHTGGTNEQPGGNNEQPGGIVSVQNRTVSGVSQKGPFITGSSVTVQELSGESLLQTGISFKGKITNDKGEFKVASINLASQYALLEVNGYYRNEVTGQNSNSPIVMYALADISDRENVNINLLTHLETDRVMHLVTVDGKSFGEAKNQAREELFGYFGFDGNFGAAEDMNIFGQSDDAAALLAVSIIVQGDLRESEFTERLARIADDIADGTIDYPEIWQQMATGVVGRDLSKIRWIIENWGESVPDYEKYVKAFLNNQIGACNEVGELKNYHGIGLICRGDGWSIGTEQEILNSMLGYCDNVGEVKHFDGFDGNGQLNPGDYICCTYGWVNHKDFDEYKCYEGLCGNGTCDPGEEEYCPDDCNNGNYCAADEIEIDGECINCAVYGFMIDGDCIKLGVCNDDNRGEVKDFNVDWYYVCKDNKWQQTDEEAFVNYTLGPCNDDILDEVRAVNAQIGSILYYVCHGYGSERRWDQIDEGAYYSQITCTPEDDAPGECYVCKNGKWSSNPDDIRNDALGSCDYEGDIKRYDGVCGYWPKGEYFVCSNEGGAWEHAGEIPPGKCSNVGIKRRIDGVCYVCGENMKWQTVDCE